MGPGVDESLLTCTSISVDGTFPSVRVNLSGPVPSFLGKENPRNYPYTLPLPRQRVGTQTRGVERIKVKWKTVGEGWSPDRENSGFRGSHKDTLWESKCDTVVLGVFYLINVRPIIVVVLLILDIRIEEIVGPHPYPAFPQNSPSLLGYFVREDVRVRFIPGVTDGQEPTGETSRDGRVSVVVNGVRVLLSCTRRRGRNSDAQSEGKY